MFYQLHEMQETFTRISKMDQRVILLFYLLLLFRFIQIYDILK